MGAMLAGMMRSPFTAILFAFELTRDADALLPLMIASFASYGCTVLMMKRSILTEKVARRGYDLFREYGVDPLERLLVRQAMTPDPQVILSDTPAVSLADGPFARGKHRAYPVVEMVGGNKKVLGMLSVSDLLGISALEDRNTLLAKDLLTGPPISIAPLASCRLAAEMMARHAIGRLLVIDEKNSLVGILTRSDLLKARQIDSEEENRRERINDFVLR
jgi:CBS domain-containing protein